MKQIIGLLALVLAITPFLAGCQPAAPTGPGAATPAPKVLRLVLNDEVPSLDPAQISNPLDISVGLNLFNGLTQWDLDWNIKPAVAKEWTISPDGIVWTFKLRNDVKFTNGDPVTAKDFKYGWSRALWPETKSPYTFVFDDVKGAKEVTSGATRELSGVRVVDDYTFEVTLARPAAYFLGATGLWTASPVSQKAVEQYGSEWTQGGKLVGNGAYILKEWNKPTRLVLEANPNYFEGKPKIDRVEVYIIKEPATALLKYENDELDVVEVPTADFERISKDPKFAKEFGRATVVGARWITFNLLQPPFKGNKALREAIAYGVDRKKVVEFAFANAVDPAHRLLPPGLAGYNKELNWPEFDLAKAKQKLAEAGYSDGKGFPAIKFVSGAFLNDRKGVESIVAQLKANLGLELAVDSKPWSTYSAWRRDPNAPEKTIILGSWGNDYPDPHNWYDPLFVSNKPFNYGRWSNERFDRLVAEAGATTDMEKRIKLYTEAERLILDDMAAVPLWFHGINWLAKPHVVGFKYPPNYWPQIKYVSIK